MQETWNDFETKLINVVDTFIPLTEFKGNQSVHKPNPIIKGKFNLWKNDLSFIRIHEMYNRATPDKFLLYKHALTLYKIMNGTTHSLEWVLLNFNVILTSRQTTFMALKNNKMRVGLNAFANRVFILNNRIPLDWFNMTQDTFKVYCKREFLSNM